MIKTPRDKPRPGPEEAREGKFGGATVPGGLYDRHGPIPVPEAHESDTESAWALFEESVMLQDKPTHKPAPTPRPTDQPHFADTNIEPAGFEPTDFDGYDTTRAAPLKP